MWPEDTMPTFQRCRTSISWKYTSRTKPVCIQIGTWSRIPWRKSVQVSCTTVFWRNIRDALWSNSILSSFPIKSFTSRLDMGMCRGDSRSCLLTISSRMLWFGKRFVVMAWKRNHSPNSWRWHLKFTSKMPEKACIIVYPQAYGQSHVLARFHQLPLLQGGFSVVCCQHDPFCSQANEIWKHDEAVNSNSRTSSKCGKSGRNALRKIRDFVQAEELLPFK